MSRHGHGDGADRHREERVIPQTAARGRDDGAAGPRSARATATHPLARLQRTVGNSAVTALLQRGPVGRRGGPVASTTGPVQRDDGAGADEGGDAREIQGLDPALEAQLRDLFPIQQGPGAEVITTSTGAQSTTGELTSRALQLWRREHVSLDDAYRRAADEELAPAGGVGPDVVPTRGGAAPPDQVVLHWGVLLAAWDYANRQGRADPADAAGLTPYLKPEDGGHSGNLGDVRAMLRQGSPFMRAATGYDRHLVVENPTSTQMASSIYDAVDDLAALLTPGQRAQLTVNFQGHGGGGAIEGVDGEVLGRGELLSAARYASEQGVHVTYVLDTCNAGAAALLAENHEYYDLATRSADAPPEAQAAVASLGRRLMPIFQIGLELNDIATALRFQRLRNDAERATAVATMERAIALIDQLGEHLAEHPDIPGLAEASLVALSPKVTFRVMVDRGRFSLRQMRDARETLAPVLDHINDLLSEQVDAMAAASPEAPTAR